MSKNIKVIIFAVICLLLLGMAWSASARGWGYAGYGTQYSESRGYYGHRGPSFFYFGSGGRYYPTNSTRSGSLGGPGSAGSGPGAGK